MLVAVKSPPSPADAADALADHFVEMSMLDANGLERGRRTTAKGTALVQRFKTLEAGAGTDGLAVSLDVYVFRAG